MEIRKSRVSDLDEIMSLYSELMEFEMSLLEGDMKDIQLNWERKKTRGNIEGFLRNETMRIFVAEDDDNETRDDNEIRSDNDIKSCKNIQGFIVGATSKGIKHKEGSLDIYIREEYRGKGIGTGLMDRMFEWFREEGCASVLINAYAANSAATNFYKKYGLELLGETYKMKL